MISPAPITITFLFGVVLQVACDRDLTTETIRKNTNNICKPIACRIVFKIDVNVDVNVDVDVDVNVDVDIFSHFC